MKTIKISAKSLNLKFHACTPDFIKTVCKGRCCRTGKTCMVTIHPSEALKFSNVQQDGHFLTPINGMCPYQTGDGLCSRHIDKPMGCIVSPFTLSKKGTLIVRNRYKMLTCYKTEPKLPAWIVHSNSLKWIIGDAGYDLVEKNMNSEPATDFTIDIDDDKFKVLTENDAYKREVKK